MEPRYYGLSTKSFNEFQFCSNKCSQNNIEVRHKIKQTNLQIYGAMTALGNVEIQEKKKKLYKNKTGYENPAQNPDVQKKMKETCSERYGVEYAMQNEQIFLKSRKNDYRLNIWLCLPVNQSLIEDMKM